MRSMTLCLAVLAAVACNNKPVQGEAGGPCYPNGTCNASLMCAGGYCVPGSASVTPAPQSDGPGAATALQPSVAAAADTGEQAAMDFVKDPWLSSQQTGDFTRYKTLLSQDFMSISKRPNRDQMDETTLATWLKKRQKIIQKGTPFFTISKLSTRLDPQGDIVVAFQYLWNPDDYCDQGSKELTLRRSGESFLVAREETTVAEECSFACYGSFRTFIGTLVNAIRQNKWDYIGAHVRFPFVNDEWGSVTSLADLPAVKKNGFIRELKWAELAPSGVHTYTTPDEVEYTYKYIYTSNDPSRATITINEYYIGSATQMVGMKYSFEFSQDRWYITSRKIADGAW